MQSSRSAQLSTLSTLSAWSTFAAVSALCALCALAIDPSTANATPDPLLPTEEARRHEQLRTLKDVPVLDAEFVTRPETSASAWMAALGVVLLGGGLALLRRRRTAAVSAKSTFAQATIAPNAIAPATIAPRVAFAAALEPAVRITNPDDTARLAALEHRIAGLENSLLQVVENVEQVAVRMEARLDRSARKQRRSRRAALQQGQARTTSFEHPMPSTSYASTSYASSAAVRSASFTQEERPAVPRFDGPWSDPPVLAPPPPTPATAAAPELAPRDPRQARELVMGLVRRGYDRAQIQAETRLPAGDVALILTSLRQPAAERAAESARFGR